MKTSVAAVIGSAYYVQLLFSGFTTEYEVGDVAYMQPPSAPTPKLAPQERHPRLVQYDKLAEFAAQFVDHDIASLADAFEAAIARHQAREAARKGKS